MGIELGGVNRPKHPQGEGDAIKKPMPTPRQQAGDAIKKPMPTPRRPRQQAGDAIKKPIPTPRRLRQQPGDVMQQQPGDVIKNPALRQLEVVPHRDRLYVRLHPRTNLPSLIPPKLSAQTRPLVKERAVLEEPGAGNVKLRSEALFAGLPSRESFEGYARAPKKDIKFCGLFTIKRSTNYKAILAQMDHLDKEKAKPTFSSTKKELQYLADRMDVLKLSTDKYANKKFHSRKSEVLELSKAIDREKSVVSDLLSQLGPENLPPEGMSISKILDCGRAGIPLFHMKNFDQQGAELKAVLDLIKASPRPLELKARLDVCLNAGATLQEAKAYCDQQILLQQEQDRLYSAHNLKVIPETQIKYVQSDIVGTPKKFGSGNVNTVFQTEYKDGTTQIFKPLQKPDMTRRTAMDIGWVARKTGIDLYDPQLAMRNIATCSLATELGFDVVSKTQLGIQKAPGPNQPSNVPPDQWESQLGLVMEKALGKDAYETSHHLYNDPDVRKEVTKLQLLDALTGQGDRHSHNYFIDKNPNGLVRVVGIDNDQCFGKYLTDPEDAQYTPDPSNRGFRGCLLPNIIDTDMAKSIEDLTSEKLAALLGDKLSPAEVASTQQRLTGMKTHVRQLRTFKQIIEPHQWADPAVISMNSAETSYIVRDQQGSFDRKTVFYSLGGGANNNINNLNNIGRI